MKRTNLTIFLIVVALIGGTAGVLGYMRTHQKLGMPGLKTSQIPGSIRLKIELPEKVLDYTSEWQETDDVTLGSLPQDTSFGCRIYKAPDGFALQMQAVMQGTDRTSIHKPQFCLRGQGLEIVAMEAVQVPISSPMSYELPVMRVTAAPEKPEQGNFKAFYVYWFVADDAITAEHGTRRWWMAKNLVSSGELQRWAYVSCYGPFAPGQEQATFERLKLFIADAVPQFQLVPKPGQTASRQP